MLRRKLSRAGKAMQWLLPLFFMLNVAPLRAGGRVNNGGVVSAQEVKYRFNALMDYIKARQAEQKLLTEFEVTRLDRVLWDTRIIIAEQRPVDSFGQAADAANQDDTQRPGKRSITFYRPYLEKILDDQSDPTIANRFLLHEFLLVAGVNDEQYDVSTKLLQGFRLDPREAPLRSGLYHDLKPYLTAGDYAGQRSPWRQNISISESAYPLLFSVQAGRYSQASPTLFVQEFDLSGIGTGLKRKTTNAYGVHYIRIDLKRDFDEDGKVMFLGEIKLDVKGCRFLYKARVYSEGDRAYLEESYPQNCGDSPTWHGKDSGPAELRNLATFYEQEAGSEGWRAAASGDLAGVKKWLASGHDINATDHRGRTLLMAAMRQLKVSRLFPLTLQPTDAVINYLMEQGADASKRDERDWTVIDYLLEGGNFQKNLNLNFLKRLLPADLSSYAGNADRLAFWLASDGQWDLLGKMSFSGLSINTLDSMLDGFSEREGDLAREEALPGPLAARLLEALVSQQGVTNKSLLFAIRYNLANSFAKYLDVLKEDDTNLIAALKSARYLPILPTQEQIDLTKILILTIKDQEQARNIFLYGWSLQFDETDVLFRAGIQTYAYDWNQWRDASGKLAMFAALQSCNVAAAKDLMDRTQNRIGAVMFNSTLSPLQLASLKCPGAKLGLMLRQLMLSGISINAGFAHFNYDPDSKVIIYTQTRVNDSRSVDVTGIADLLYLRLSLLTYSFSYFPKEGEVAEDLRWLKATFLWARSLGVVMSYTPSMAAEAFFSSAGL